MDRQCPKVFTLNKNSPVLELEVSLPPLISYVVPGVTIPSFKVWNKWNGTYIADGRKDHFHLMSSNELFVFAALS